MAESRKKAAKARAPRRKRKAAEPGSKGLAASELAAGERPRALSELARQVEEDGGSVLGAFREPLGGHWQLLAGLPIDKVSPTPYQRDLSPAHMERLQKAIGGLERFLDPIIAVRGPDGGYWTPNGSHRTAAMKALGAKSIVALLVTEPEVSFRILALNTEKAHNLREKSLEVLRLAQALAELDPRAEQDFSLEFEEPSLLTLGLCYEHNGRFSGGAYHPVLKRTETFLEQKLPAALERRRKRAALLQELDEAVVAAVNALKERGFQSPYLKAFVVARINPLRFVKPIRGKEARKPDPDETLEKMLAAARKFDAAKVKAGQVAAASGPPEE
ncbi:MAG: chromosome partitioning protein ParB [Planctomycetota bacterium]|nr:MAG: chromosome partitioning protein ParB [Planctomycetota bacterium]